jgi:myxalamid-type polyketide synthase MxaB
MPLSTNESEKVLRVIERLEAEVASLRRAQSEPVAIVGMSCRFPGASTPEAFWARLDKGEESTSEVPRSRWNVDLLYSEDPDAPGRMSTRRGGFLEDVAGFDASFFEIVPREAVLMDPQQRLLLELAWEALEDAAIPADDLYGSPVGVFVGIGSSDYYRMAIDAGEITAYLGTGNATSVAAGRIAYTFGFTGPCVSLDTACSSALVALHYAADSLRKGECRLALAGSANVILAPEVTVAFSKARMMAPDGRCKTFDERANGYVRSEGAAIVALKTLSAARADGDRILGVVLGSAINQDGASGGLTVPNGPAQTALVRRALERAGLEPANVDYVETHGTGTALGDPIEVLALAEVFARSPRDRPLHLGSVKTLTGHLEVAAGMAGLLKVLLSLRHDRIPPYPQLGHLSSRIPWRDLPFEVSRAGLPWPRSTRPRVAGISAFGFSGTNAHVVVREPPRVETAPPSAAPAHLLVLSAKTQAALLALAGSYTDWLTEHPGARLDEVTWTANTGRARLPHRLAVRADGIDSLRDQLVAFASATDATPGGVHQGVAPAVERQLALLFTGQGSQHAGMGKELYELHPAFRATIVRCEEVLTPHLRYPLRDLLWGSKSALLDQTEYTQPALFALEYALASLWLSWGLRPSYVLGHSVGAIAAACVAGFFSLEDGLRFTAARGRLMQSLPAGGAMAVIAGGPEVVHDLVDRSSDRVAIAALNAPDQTVISGDRSAVLAVCAALEVERGVHSRGLLDVSHAFHSPLMRPIARELALVAESIRFGKPQLEMISDVSGDVVSDAAACARYWVEHALAPVRFRDAVHTLESRNVSALLEVGPGTTLLGLARACSAPDRFVMASSLRTNAGAWSSMIDAAGALFVHGVWLDWTQAARCDPARPSKCALPTYPFQRSHYWLRGALGARRTTGVSSFEHPLLGSRLRNATLGEGDAHFEAALSRDAPAYLQQHRVYDKVIVPATAYVEMGLAAAAGARLEDAPGAVLRNLAVHAALSLPGGRETVVQTVVRAQTADRFHFEVLSDAPGSEHDEWQVHASGEIEISSEAPARLDMSALLARCPARPEADVAALYARYAALGLGYQGAFRSIVALRGGLVRIGTADRSDPSTDEGRRELLARICPPAVTREEASRYILHPALLDGCLQAVGALVADAEVVYLPVGVDELRVWPSVKTQGWAHAVLRATPASGQPLVIADVRLVGDSGEVLCQIEGLKAVRADRRALSYATATWKRKLYTLGWVPRERTGTGAAASPGRFLVIGERGAPGEELRAALEARGQRCELVLLDDATHPMDEALCRRVLEEGAASSDLPLVCVVFLSARHEHERTVPRSLEASVARTCESALALVQATMAVPTGRPPRLWFVTRGAQGDVADPAQGALWGMGRAVALEHPSLACTCIDMGEEALGALAAELIDPDRDQQVAYRDGRRCVARLQRMSSAAPSFAAAPGETHRVRALAYGSLDELKLVVAPRRAPEPSEVEIEVRAASVNFKDVLHVLGMLRNVGDRAGERDAVDQALGFECAGRVVRIGDQVTGLAPGDEVFAIGVSAMARHLTVDARFAHKKPTNLTFEQAASIPAAFMTAMYALDRLAHLRQGETILIHACAGGVGQAALQVAHARGATVFATASPTKWAHLRGQGVEHVMHSRTLDFVDEVRRITGGRGVDVVLNSLSGAFIEASAEVLREGGRFVEIGKVGAWAPQRMAAHRPDVQYFTFDLEEVDPSGAVPSELLDQAARGLETGTFAPLPVKIFPAQRASAAFGHLAHARNIGKVVLRFGSPEDPRGPVRPDRSYWITGGLGALGLSVAERLVALGARQLVLSSRRPPDAHASAIIESLQSKGATVRVEAMDVADPSAVTAVAQRIARELAPLGGIVHAAGVLDDGIIPSQTPERFARVLAPKVAGGWNLHCATRDGDIDFFVLFSSIASLFGSPGQTNYAAANAFLDALAAHRAAQGLPATSIQWGPWAATGMADAARDANRARLEAFGVRGMSASDSLEVFGWLLSGGPATIAVADVDWARYRRAAPNAGTSDVYSLLERRPPGVAARQGDDPLERLSKAEPADREAILVEFLQRQAARVAGLPDGAATDPEKPLLEMGFDSLMAVELKSRVEASLRCALPATLLVDHPTLRSIARYVVGDVLRPGPASPRERGPTSTAVTEPAERDDDAERPLSRMRESYVDFGGGPRLCVASWGAEDAPLVVCVHGILDQSASWDEVACGLAAHRFRVRAPDLRGHGRSAHHPSSASLSVLDFLADLEAATCEMPCPFSLVGHSTGAVVAALYASAHPARVRHLVLVEPILPFLREHRGALEVLKNDLRYRDEPPAHAVFPDLETGASMLELSYAGLSAHRAAALARRVTEPCQGGLRWTWDPRLRNPLGVDLAFSRRAYLALLAELPLASTRIYGEKSQFAGTDVLLQPEVLLPRSRTVVVAGGHNLHTDNAAAVIRATLADLPSLESPVPPVRQTGTP